MTTQITRFSLEDFRDLALSWMEANGFQPVPGEPPSWDFQVLTGNGEGVSEKQPVLIVPTVIQPRWTTAVEGGATPPSYEVLNKAEGRLLGTSSATSGAKTTKNAASQSSSGKVVGSGRKRKYATEEEASREAVRNRRQTAKKVAEARLGEKGAALNFQPAIAVEVAEATPSVEPPPFVPTDDLVAQPEPAEAKEPARARAVEEMAAVQEAEMEEVAGAEVARETFRY